MQRSSRTKKKSVKAGESECSEITSYYFPLFSVVFSAFNKGKDWFPGIVIGQSRGEDLSSTYTILYDDGDVECNVEEIYVELKFPSQGLYLYIFLTIIRKHVLIKVFVNNEISCRGLII